MRTLKISPGEYYHLYNRGVAKQSVFLDERDWVRFLFLITHFQSLTTFTNTGRYITHYVKHRVFNISNRVVEKIIRDRKMVLNAFCFMPNHFHLLVHERDEGGISRYMQRVLNAYTKYFNAKYQRSGHLFQGPYQAVHVSDNNQLLHLSAYIHRNPRELRKWKNKEDRYPWSSYQDYIKYNRWSALLDKSIVADQFGSSEEYNTFVKTSTAKDDQTILERKRE